MSQELKSPTGCVGCGILSPEHPIVAVMRPGDVPSGTAVSEPGPNGFVSAPVCKDCHEDPAHRVRPIKGHFFQAHAAGTAVQRAGDNQLGR